MSHRAMRVIDRNLREFFFCFFVPERMQERHAAIERLLHRGSAGNRKNHRAQLSARQVFVGQDNSGKHDQCENGRA
jgi:hypothetical protein